MKRPQHRMTSWLVACASLLFCAAALAQTDTYPARPIKFVIPFPPGGSNDIVGRMIATQLGERLGTTLVIENRAGAGGTIGTEQVAKAAPDGYTLLLVSIAYAFNPSLYKRIGYDPERAFVPVAMLAAGPMALSVWPGLPVATVPELIALAKAKPGALHFASAGVGSFQHLGCELFRIQAGIDLLHVPYKGGGPATTDVIAGHAHISPGSLIQSIPHIRAGKLKVLATSGSKRSSLLPEVPTIAETLPGFAAENWWGILAPAGTPESIVKRLQDEIDHVLGSPQTEARFRAEGAEVVRMRGAAFGAHIRRETEKWARVVKESGIRSE